MVDESIFLEKCEEARGYAFSFKDPLIVHHYDADGISSGAVVASAFLKQGKKFRRECIKKLDDGALERFEREQEIIFVDLGGGNKKVNELKDVLIIDHHQTEGIEKFQINPCLHGIDGGTELSASTTAYCVFRELVDVAIVGAAGDMQSPFSGMNRWVLEQGMEKGDVKIEEDIRFYGRYCRSLVQFLSYCDDPYIPGISYREDRTVELLNELKINFQENRKYVDLTMDERKSLISALAKILINYGQLKKVNELVGESYVFPKRPKDETFEANEFSTLLNACGRHSQPDIGVMVCLGDEEAQVQAKNLLQHHRKMLRDGIEYANNKIQNLGAFYFLDGRGIIDEGIIGTVCGMAFQQKWNRPVIGIASGENNTIKISGRGSKSLVEAGLNLGELMKRAVDEIGGAGGGHRIAAGASIPKEKLNEFLRFTGSYLGKNMPK
ncbi:DHHA1 domain protein [Candidatus Bilamarchaeum dharawalense]|uniref:DHHA1 domain protein n=1 Tax=Candidatus Bilamarchaeum dharawalense TaxID=2885759 RepID=A0A5E4LS09_9ARCH|nr:DHHA1 domain protein [Candidatus Bilamarchaeum dharawalense]